MRSLKVNKSFWRGRRVLVTGHTGFKGAWLCLWLKYLGAEVWGYSLNPPTQPSLFNLALVKNHLTSGIGDVRDFRAFKKFAFKAQPQIAFHLAAQSLVRASYDAPWDTYSTNLMGTVNFLEILRTCSGLQAAVVITTDKCYQNCGSARAFKEDDPLGGLDPYSTSKAGAELITRGYRQGYPAKLATARAGNIIGGGDWAPDRLIPDLVGAFSRGRELIIRNPRAVRPWQFVLEALDGYLRLAQALTDSSVIGSEAQAFNFGPEPGSLAQVGEVASLGAQLWGGESRWRCQEVDDCKPEADVLTLNSDLAFKTLGWRNILNLEEALKLTIDWYKSWWRESFDLAELSFNQIVDYEKLNEQRRIS